MTMIQTIISHIENNITFKQNEAVRLFHGRGKVYKNLEHINIDYFYPTIIIYLYKETDKEWLNELSLRLKNLTGIKNSIKCIVVQNRYLANKSVTVLFGSLPQRMFAEENGLKYQIKLGEAQNIGFFPDMKNVRHWLLYNSENLRVLNLFSYTCSLSVAAATGNASMIVNVDMNRNFLSIGKKNHSKNKVDTGVIKYLPHNIFKSWNKIKKYGPYDIIIIDPPFFQSGSFNLLRDYQKIISRIHQLRSTTSKIIATINYPYLDKNYLIDLFNDHCPDYKSVSAIPAPDEFKESEHHHSLKIFKFEYSDLS